MRAPEPWRFDLVKDEDPEVRRLAELFREKQVRKGVYSHEQMEAMSSPQAECSWAARGDMQTKPWTLVLRSADDRAIAGVEILQQKRDRYWFLDMLVRN